MDAELKKFYEKYKFYLFPTVTVFCCVLLVAVVVLPQSIKLINNQKSEDEIIYKVKAINAKADELSNYSERDLKSKLQAALMILPTDKDFAGAIGYLQQTITQLGFVVGSIQLGQGSSGKSSNSYYLVAVQASGPKSQISNLMQSIENSGRIMKVESIDINPTQKGDVVNVSFDVSVYYASSGNRITSSDTSLPKLSDKDNQLLAKYAQPLPVVQQASATANISEPRGREDPFN